jgi:chorismate mutase-like protein
MDLAEWRKKIDEIDRQLIRLLNERAKCAQQVGRLKRNTDMPIYEPDRERIVFENVQRANEGPLPEIEVRHIYERIIDVMRKLQKEEIVPATKSEADGAPAAGTEFDIEVNE